MEIHHVEPAALALQHILDRVVIGGAQDLEAECLHPGTAIRVAAHLLRGGEAHFVTQILHRLHMRQRRHRPGVARWIRDQIIDQQGPLDRLFLQPGGAVTENQMLGPFFPERLQGGLGAALPLTLGPALQDIVHAGGQQIQQPALPGLVDRGPDGGGQPALQPGIGGAQPFQQDRRARQHGAIHLPQHADQIGFRRRQAAGNVDPEAVPAAANGGGLQIRAMIIGEHPAHDLPIDQQHQPDAAFGIEAVLRPAGDAFPIDIVQPAAQLTKMHSCLSSAASHHEPFASGGHITSRSGLHIMR